MRNVIRGHAFSVSESAMGRDSGKWEGSKWQVPLYFDLSTLTGGFTTIEDSD